jgi:hypothetical protein
MPGALVLFLRNIRQTFYTTPLVAKAWALRVSSWTSTPGTRFSNTAQPRGTTLLDQLKLKLLYAAGEFPVAQRVESSQ